MGLGNATRALKAGVFMQKLEPFGQIAIGMRFCEEEDVQEALAAQGKLKAEEKEHKLIGMILLEQGALSTAQLIQILQYYQHSGRVPGDGDEFAGPDNPSLN